MTMTSPEIERREVERPGVERRDLVEPRDVRRVIRTRTLDDVAANVGSALASFAAVWLVFNELLGLNGVLGFLLCWFVAYLGFYVAVSLRSHPGVAVVDRVVSAVIHLAALVAGAALDEHDRLRVRQGLARAPPPELLHA